MKVSACSRRTPLMIGPLWSSPMTMIVCAEPGAGAVNAGEWICLPPSPMSAAICEIVPIAIAAPATVVKSTTRIAPRSRRGRTPRRRRSGIAAVHVGRGERGA